VLATLGAASAAIILPLGTRNGRVVLPDGSLLPACVVRPAQTEGPYFVDEKLHRSDIRSDPADGSMRPGAPLRLALRVSRLTRAVCAPLPGATVDLWHCDALGVYSGEPSEGSSGETYLRGIQLTGADGRAEFATIYPGQYPGRTTHIHLKVHLGGRPGNGGYSGGHVSHVGQLFTADRDDAEVFALVPYDRNPAEITPRGADFIFRDQGGSSSELALERVGTNLARDGFSASATLGVDPSATF
jgi:protocatechuate 3,4-dioxygenase beta subunit